MRSKLLVSVTVLVTCTAFPAFAESVDSLRGQFAFDWHLEPAKTKCAAVDGSLLATFKSDAFHCNLTVVTNTASDQPAIVCTKTDDTAEYLIFQTLEACELERETQASNGD